MGSLNARPYGIDKELYTQRVQVSLESTLGAQTHLLRAYHNVITAHISPEP